MKEEMKTNVKDFAKVYGPMILFMCLLAGLEALGGHASGAAACAGIAAIYATMYIISIVFSAVIELVAAVKR